VLGSRGRARGIGIAAAQTALDARFAGHPAVCAYGAGIGSRDRGVAAVARLRAAAGSASIRERS
jgi:hypothetical protein